MKQLFIMLLLGVFTLSVAAQDVETHRKKGEEFLNNGSPEEALGEFQKAIALVTEPTGNGIVYSYAGICAQQMKDDDMASGFFRQAIDRGFQDEKVYEWLGNIYRKQKDYVGQEYVFKKGIETFPANALEFKKSLCNTYYYSKQYDKVEALAPEILTKDADDLKVLSQYAGALQRLKKNKEAKAKFEELVAKDPEDLNANIFLGNYYFQYGKALEAKEDARYKKIVKPSRVQWAESNKKILKIRSDYYGNAVKYLETAYAAKPNPNIKKMLFATYTKLGEKEKAEKYQ